MVDLPKVADRIVTSTAPESAVSRGDIQQNADLMAGALNKVADAQMSIAERQAKDQAAEDLQNQKVTLNADGSVNVVNPANSLIFGRAGEQYHAAVMAGTIAQHSNVISTELNDIHQKYPTDPAAFKTAAEAWKAKYVEQHGGGEVGQAISQQFDQGFTQHYNSITNSAAQTDLATQNSAITASQTSARDDVMAMLRGGALITDKAVQSKIERYDAATAARASNPLFAYSKEQAELDRETFHSEATASKLLFEVDKIYKSQGEGGGYKGAMDAAKDILTNPGYKLSEQQRDQYYHKATADIRANEAMRRQDLSEARSAYNELSLASAAGGRIDSDQVETVAKAFRAAGDPGGAARVYSSFLRKNLNDDFGKQPLSAQTQQLSALQGVNAAASAHQFFVGKGYTPEQAAGIVGNLVHESGLDPSAMGDGGTSGGLAQFHNERLTALKKFASDRGKPANDFGTQLEFIDSELHTTEARTLTKLQAAKTPEEAAHAFIDYERPQGWTPENPAGGLGYESRKALARTVFDGKPAVTDKSMGPAGSMWLEANRQRTLDTAAQTQWSTIMAEYKSSGVRPSPQKVTEIVNAARVSRNSDFLETIAHDADRMDVAFSASRGPLPMQAAAISTMQAAGAAGDLSPGHAALLQDLQKRNAAITKGLDENPIATTVQNFPDQLKPPGPLDFSSAGGLAGSIANRAAIAQFGALNWNTPQLAVLDQADVKQVQAALQGPQGGTVLSTMSGVLKPEEMHKLLDQKEFKDSVVGMQASLDFGKMTSANAVVEGVWQSNPALAESVLGSKSIEKMQTWQALKDTFGPEELAKILNRNDDPALAKARKEAVAAAGEEVSKLSPGEMAYRLGTGLPILNSLTGNLSGATPNLPFDSLQGAALVNEFTAARAELRASGVDSDKADAQGLERLRSSWGPSQAAGNQLMKMPPEKYYPAIDGKKDWIGEQLNGWIAKQVGAVEVEARKSEHPLFGEADVAKRNWSLQGLVSDSTTAAEIKARRPPSYQVAIMHNGMMEILPKRIIFDQTKYLAAHEADLRRQQREIAINRSVRGGDSGDFMNLDRPYQTTDRPSYLFGEAMPQ